MIYYFTPSSTDKNLGMAYNLYAQLLKTDDWMCLQDRDVMFLQEDYLHIIQETVDKHPEVSLFTCLTNRVGNPRQCYKGEISEDPNILNHYDIAKSLGSQRTDVVYTENVISGHLMLIQKKTWSKIGGAKNGLLSVDNDISRKVLASGGKIGIMQGLYVFHYYRMKSGRLDKSHLL